MLSGNAPHSNWDVHWKPVESRSTDFFPPVVLDTIKKQ